MRNVKAEDLYEYKFVSRPSLSPDGRRAVFTVTACDREKNAYRADLWLLEDGAPRPLTVSGDAKGAQWLDGDTLLFSALRSEEDKKAKKERRPLTVFHTLDLRGGEAREFLRLPLRAKELRPLSGGRFALLCDYDRNEGEEPDYEVFEEIPFWGNSLGYTSGKRNRLYLWENGEARPLTDEYEQVGSFAVRGGAILYAAHMFRGRDGVTDGVFLWEDGAVRTLVPDGAWSVSWVGFLGATPVALMSDMKPYGQSQNPYFYALDGESPRLLSDRDEHPGSTLGGDSVYGGGETVVSDGESIVYAVAAGTGSALRRLTAQGVETLLTTAGSLDALTAGHGRVLCASVQGQRLSELYELTDGALTRRSDFNEALFAERELPAPQPLQAQNGTWSIEGFVLPPAGYDRQRSYPAILDIHGGPRGAYGGQFFHEMQVWAGAGYFVIFCNPRGGDGRGNEFADLRGRFGGIDYDDLMAFVDEALRQYPQIDAKRLGVTGGSYGGFMTNWIIGHTDRFAAAASQRSIANWTTKFLCTDIGYRYNGEQLGADPWSDPEELWRRSPVRYADKARTPTLFIHSDEDYRCWLAEGLQMFTALNYHGVEARLCLFHGENHGLSRSGKPQHRVRRINEITAWMDRYLK